MAQLYHKQLPGPPHTHTPPHTPTAASLDAEAARVLKETKAFVDDRDTLLLVIDQSDELLLRLRDFGQQTWMLAYPQDSLAHPAPASTGSGGHHLRRMASECETGAAPNPARPACHPRAATSFEPSAQEPLPKSSGALNILAVDYPSLPGRRTSGAIKDIESSLLVRQSLASMLCSRLDSVQSHLHDLRTRVIDRNSRILVTGDLNAGKSTFVNALLGRDVAPTDQQPCTEVMCEILDSSHNCSKEEIHAIPHGSSYEIEDKSTYEVFELGRLSELVSDVNEGSQEENSSPYQLLKVYIASPTGNENKNEGNSATDAISLLRNGDISVSFIDSPGLNRDTLSTMELFSKQSTIDVVVFVVSAENQFTLSAQEFLWAASQEKAYVFVVVNKWAAIRDKNKAERRIRDQLRKLSPGTWEERSELVHFVDAQSASAQTNSEEAFDHLQRSLSSFVFLRRAISKLQPAQTYTRHLLQDLALIASTNKDAAEKLYEAADARLHSALPRYEQLLATSAVLEESVGTIEEETVSRVQRSGTQILNAALSQIKQGQLPVLEGKPQPYFPTYDGLLTIFHYAEDVRKAFLASLEDSISVAEDVARGSTAKAVEAIRLSPTTTNILEESGDLQERKFNPKAMFTRRRRFAGLQSSEEPKHLQEFAAATRSIGLASFGDLIDLERLNWFGPHDHLGKVSDEQALISGGSIVGSIGFGTLTLFGTGVTGGRAFVEGLVKVSEVLGSRGARKWTGAAIGLMTVGFGIYLITDIPRAIPQNIGRKLERELDSLSTISCPESKSSTTWVESEVDRLTKETRKVVRLAGWDLRQRFRTALEEAGEETEGARCEIEKAVEAIGWLQGFGADVEGLRSLVDGVRAGWIGVDGVASF